MSAFGLSYAPSETLGFVPRGLERLTEVMARAGRGEKGAGRLDADRPPRQGRLPGYGGRLRPAARR